MEPKESWHLNKGVPVALIITLLVQFAGGVWFLSAAFKDIDANRQGIMTLNGRFEKLDESGREQAIQLSRIEESVRGLRNDINRLIEVLADGQRR